MTVYPPVPRIFRCGDSLTVGFGSTSGAGWRPAVEQLQFLARGRSTDWTANANLSGGGNETMCGGSGQETDDILTAASTWLPRYAPSGVFIWAGTNDAQRRASGSGSPPTRAQTVANLSSLIDLAQAAAAPVVIVTQLQPNLTPAKDAEFIAQDADVVAMVAAHPWTAQCTTLDLRTPTLAVPGWSSMYFDDTHYNDAGYAFVAPLIHAALLARFPVG